MDAREHDDGPAGLTAEQREIRAQVERSQLSFRALEVERLDARRSSPLQARPRLALVGGVPFPCKRVAVRLR